MTTCTKIGEWTDVENLDEINVMSVMSFLTLAVHWRLKILWQKKLNNIFLNNMSFFYFGFVDIMKILKYNILKQNWIFPCELPLQYSNE